MPLVYLLCADVCITMYVSKNKKEIGEKYGE